MAEDSEKRIKASSVAAFMFMPQLRYSFQHFSFVVPVFIRTIAAMFVSANLLPKDHPAIHYGAEGVPRYSFAQLLQEAWGHLRATSATPYQWGLFAGVIMMIAFVVIGAVVYVLNLTGMLVGSATAQIFDHPNSGGSMAAGGGSGMFNKDKGTGAHADYGIMLLDKMFREGAEGQGGTLQNALGGVMQLYNTGILVIAGIILFWIIISVVTDTARTGQIGGGRHNMVWAPIRIVFALGLLIPLGTAGYSSGQYAVIKVAEWGSNFGTRVWLRYVDGVMGVSDIVVSAKPENMTPLIKNYTGMWLCRIAYNGTAAVTMGTVPPAQLITEKRNLGDYALGRASFQFSNDTAANICGSVTYHTGDDPALLYAQGGAGFGSSVDNNQHNAAIARAMAEYKRDIMRSYARLFGTYGGGLFGSGYTQGTLAPDAKRFACGFAAQVAPLYPAAGSSDPSPLQSECGGNGGNLCGAGPAGSGQMPTVGAASSDDCIGRMVNKAYEDVNSQMQQSFSNLRSTLYNEMLPGLAVEGWPAMGRWYHQISSVNKTISEMTKPTVTINMGGALMASSQHAADVRGIMSRYNRWWQTVPQTASVTGSAPAPSGGIAGDVVSHTNIHDKIKSMTAAGKGADDEPDVNVDEKYADGIADLVMDGIDGNFLFDVAQTDNEDIYPLAQLARNGDKLVAIGTIMIGTVTAIQTALGALDFWIMGGGSFLGIGGMGGFSLGNLGKSIGDSYVFETIKTLGGAILGAGLFLSILVPMIPFIRVVFSVLTWMVSVFEAVVMVPIAALSHLTTQGEGLAGAGRNAWIIWLNVLLRPALTVIGFIGALIIFNAFVLYFHDVFTRLTITGMSKAGGLSGFFSKFSNTIIYVGIMYIAANMSFKLLDLIPSALMKYMGGSADASFDNEQTSGFMSQYNSTLSGAMKGGRTMSQGGAKWGKDKPADPGATGAK